MNIIEVKDLTKKYGTHQAVDGISFDVKEGELFAFLGENGAGKSTTINILCTILEKSSGSIRICSHELGREDDLIRKNIGIVFQNSGKPFIISCCSIFYLCKLMLSSDCFCTLIKILFFLVCEC